MVLRNTILPIQAIEKLFRNLKASNKFCKHRGLKGLLLNSPFCLSRFETVKVDEVRPESVNDSTESQSISPWLCHVDNVDTGVVLGHPVAPHLQPRHPCHQHPEAEDRDINEVSMGHSVCDSVSQLMKNGDLRHTSDHAPYIACLRNYILPWKLSWSFIYQFMQSTLLLLQQCQFGHFDVTEGRIVKCCNFPCLITPTLSISLCSQLATNQQFPVRRDDCCVLCHWQWLRCSHDHWPLATGQSTHWHTHWWPWADQCSTVVVTSGRAQPKHYAGLCLYQWHCH